MIKKNIAFWNENCIIEDYLLWNSLKKKNYKFYNIPEILTYHRIHKDSFFNSKNSKLQQKDIQKYIH